MVPSIRSIRPTLIKQYAGCRLYDPAAGAYVTLDDLAVMVEDEADFTVVDAGSGIDVTSSLLEQIIGKRALHG
jgi:polyhydroxyalkanoate synthesis regulator protein